MSREQATLIVGPSWVGDMVMAQSLLLCLRQRQPGVAIDVLAPAWSEPLLARMPQVREALHLPFDHGELRLAERRRLGRALGKRGYSQAIVLPNSLKSALVPFFAGIPVRTGWRGEMRFGLLNDIRLLDKQRYPLMIQRFAALAWPPGAPLPDALPWPKLEADREAGEQLRERLQLTAARPVLALCPGAEFGPAKRWPAIYYARVAETLIGAGWQVWLFGSGNDKPVTGTLAEALSPAAREHCCDLAGQTRLGEAIDLLAQADAVVSNDSGLMHIAAALERPMAVVYGSTSPGFTPPLAQKVETLSVPVDCGPCFQRECPLGHMKCLTGVSPERVLDALERLTA